MSSAIMYGGSMPPINGQVFQPAFVYRTIQEAAASVCDLPPETLLTPRRDIDQLVSALALYVALDGYGMPLSTMAFVSDRAISSVFKNRERARKLVRADAAALQYALAISNEAAKRLGVRPVELTFRPAADAPIPIADRRAGYRAPAHFNTPKPQARACMCCSRSFVSEGKHNRLCFHCRTKDVSPWE
ncbi:hypothetical protein [Ferrovibrio sp.]|uniref:hypothetical protein n=1 Tax=Ferrovibrio sp. TaxID=1917215 RepID=UPI0025BFB0D3|nr:hypothetical protein [Ferrovibrio sp.]MBX3455801.1 hypothetical protein [Ferrovibrio sp.]